MGIGKKIISTACSVLAVFGCLTIASNASADELSTLELAVSPESIDIDQDWKTIDIDTPDFEIKSEADLKEFLASTEPKTIIQNLNGEIVEVKQASMADPLISVANTCSTGNACLSALEVPYADYGFSGVGTKTGAWEHRRRLTSGKWTVQSWYTYKGKTYSLPATGKLAPNGFALISDGYATVHKVTIYK
jgi:hypothetical protein